MTQSQTRPPTVLQNANLLQLLEWLIKRNDGQSTIIWCGTRDAFDYQLVEDSVQSDSRDLLNPTLGRLSRAMSISFCFCPSVQAFHAYLTALKVPDAIHDLEERQQGARLVVINALKLHEATPAFSAQGLSRCFAAAVAASARLSVGLILAELPTRQHHSDVAADSTLDPQIQLPEDAVGADEEEMSDLVLNPWSVEVPILNATTRSFGPGERGWVGRTVAAKRVALRWLRFRDLGSV